MGDFLFMAGVIGYFCYVAYTLSEIDTKLDKLLDRTEPADTSHYTDDDDDDD